MSSSFTPKQKGQLISLGQLESLGLLASSVAHDLNNILTGVLGHVSFLRILLSSEGKHVESLLAIEDGARRGASMTQQILEFVRCQPAQRSRVNLSEILSAAICLIRPGLTNHIHLEVQNSETSLWILGNEGQLTQLIMNLALNARDALPQGGNIDIIVKRIDNEENDFEPSEKIQYPYLKLVVRDSGVGIPAEIQEHIFEPFFTTKENGGTGLGLATVSSIIQMHGGTIDVRSQGGQGTEFSVCLPLLVEDTHRPYAMEVRKDSEREQIPTGGENILVVDDEETVRTVIQRCLEHLGYKVEVAANGKEALELYQKKLSFYQLIILDMLMPQMPGDEVFFQLQEIEPSVSVLIASGYASDERSSRVLQAGACGFIQKPFAVEELAREVRRCLDLNLPREGKSG